LIVQPRAPFHDEPARLVEGACRNVLLVDVHRQLTVQCLGMPDQSPTATAALELWGEEQGLHLAAGHPHEPHDRPGVVAENPELVLAGCEVVSHLRDHGLDVLLGHERVRRPDGAQPDVQEDLAVCRDRSPNVHCLPHPPQPNAKFIRRGRPPQATMSHQVPRAAPVGCNAAFGPVERYPTPDRCCLASCLGPRAKGSSTPSHRPPGAPPPPRRNRAANGRPAPSTAAPAAGSGSRPPPWPPTATPARSAPRPATPKTGGRRPAARRAPGGGRR